MALPWIDLGSEIVIRSDEILAVIDWNEGKTSGINREMVGYARAHGFLVDEEESAGMSLVVARDRVFLIATSARTLRKKLDRT